MGFGWLLIGYFVATLMSFNRIGALLRLIGYGLVLAASVRLSAYHRAFRWMGLGAILMLLISSVVAFSDATDFLYQNLLLEGRLISDGARMVIGYVEQGVSFVFHALMLYAIRAIAKETEVTKVANNAIRNFVFICLYYFVYLISFLPLKGVQACAAELTWITWMLYLVWMILNLLLLGSCYMRICDEGDVDMEQKPSRFAFVNRFRAENERRAEKARREREEYKREKREKQSQRRKK